MMSHVMARSTKSCPNTGTVGLYHLFWQGKIFLPEVGLSTTGGAAVGDGGGLDPGAV